MQNKGEEYGAGALDGNAEQGKQDQITRFQFKKHHEESGEDNQGKQRKR